MLKFNEPEIKREWGLKSHKSKGLKTSNTRVVNGDGWKWLPYMLLVRVLSLFGWPSRPLSFAHN